MFSLQKIITYILIFTLVSSHTGVFVYAEEDIVHTLEELPSMHEEIITDPTESMIPTETHEEELLPLSELIREKELYESKKIEILDEDISKSEDVIISSLIEEHELYIAQASLTLTPSMGPSIVPEFIVNPFISNNSASILDSFIMGYQSDKTKTEETKENGKKYAKKERKVTGTKGTITAKIPEGTVITTAEGEVITESMLDIVGLETEKKTKAQKKYEKTMKNRGNKKKGQAEASPEGFDFGVVGKHLIFSQPIAITIATPHMSEGMAVDLLTMHAGDTDFHTDGLSVDATTLCNTDGTASIPGAQAIVDGGKITFYTCGASSFTMNPSGGTAGSNDLRAIIGDCGQIQLYYNNLTQVYTGNPPATGCSTNSTMDAWPVLRIGGVSYGNDFTAWTSSTTTGTTVGNTYTATSTMTITTGGRTYQLIIDWEHTAPNKYLTWRWRVIVPAGNTLPIKFYYGMDSLVAGGDANDVGYFSNTGGTTVGIFDGTANVLSAFRYLSGTTWTAHQADGWNAVRTQIANGNNFTNNVQTTGGDLGFGANWDFGTPAVATTYSGTIEWRLAPYVSASVPDLIPGIGQPEGPLTTGFSSQMPIIISNVGNLTSSGVHTAILTIPTNITGPASAFTDNGWSCGAQIGTTVTCTKTTTIAPLGDETFRIPVIPQPAAGGTNVTFNLSISNPGDSNTGNNTAFATNAVVAAAPTIAPGGVTGAGFWSKADGGKNCTTTGCTITTWFNSGTVAVNATTGLGTVTYDPATQINYNPTLYFNNASLNINNNLALPTRANSIFVVSRIGVGGNFYIGTQTATNNTRSWRTSPTTDHWMRYNSTVYYNGANNRSANVPAITSTIRQTAGASAGYTDGRSVLTSADTTTFTVNNLGIGRNANTNSTLSNVAEVIIYNSALTAANQNRVESYLALKYGITLDQTTARNYIFANGTTTSWNAALAGVYNRDIAGVARDDLTGLNQQRSQSINNSGDIIVNTVAGSIGSNARALIWGNNGTATGTFSTTDVPVGYQRIDREWQFQEKNGDVGNIKISYPTASLPSGAGSPVYMLVDSDGAFAAGATAYTGTLIGGNWEWTINMTDMSIITFAQAGDITPPTISSASIASGTLIPHGNFSLTYNYTDTGAGINPTTATGRIYSWNTGTLTYNVVPTAGYMTIGSSSATSTTMNISGLPHGRYRLDLDIADLAGNTATRSFTYFVDAIEWTISADTYNIGNITQNIATFGTGELTITIRTVGAGFSLTTSPVSILARPSGETLNYWNGTLGVGYDIWSGGAFGGTILTYSPNSTLANVGQNINQNGEKNTFVYRVKYGATVDFMQAAGDYTGSVSFGLNLDY